MKLLPPQLYHLIGLGPTGDLGPCTFYTKNNQTVVFFLKAPPKEPPTQHQRHQRNQFRLAAISWQQISPQLRAAWTATQARANLKITGYNLWIHYQTTGDRPAIETIQRQTGLTLLP